MDEIGFESKTKNTICAGRLGANLNFKRALGEVGKRVVSYSRNVFLPITNLCRNRCAYCGFRRDPNDGAWFMPPQDVIELAKRAKTAGCSEALLTLGEQPEVHAEAREKLEALGHESTVDYLKDLCKQILELGLLPHSNAGVLSEYELWHLRRYNASMGLMPVTIRSATGGKAGRSGQNPV